MKFTRKGFHRLVAGNGAFISQHTDLNEAYERAAAHAQQQEAGEHRYRIVPAEIELVLITVKADVRPPTAPVISLGAFTASAITVSLTAPSTDAGGVASYSLERATSAAGPFTELTANATFPYVDSGLTAGTTYHYRVRATDLSGNVGNYSAITAGATQSPSAEWLANSPAYLPLLPGAAGRGFQQSAASGRHNVTAGLAAAPTIHFVTNLNLSGAGSARAALEATGDRIIIPAISGVVDFSGLGDNSRQCIVGSGRVIWAGQCAPSPGLILFGLQVVLNLASNANSLMWHLAAHQSPYTDFAIQASRGDVVNHFHAVGSPVLDSNIVHANCTYMWGNDETVDIFYGANDFTFWQCLFAEALYNTANSNGTELGYGPFLGNDRTTAQGEFIRCAMIHNNERNPSTRGALVSILNCLTFDTPSRGIQLSIEDGTPTQTNIEGNLAITGPGSNPSRPFFQQNTGEHAMTSACQVYLNGNRALGWTETTQAAMLSSGASTLVGSRITAAYPAGYNVTPIDDRTAFARLVARDCGARPADRAAVHQRIFNHLEARLTGTGSQGGLIGFPSEVSMVVPSNTVNHTVGTDPIPGIIAQSTTPTTLGAAGCGVMASGYTAFEEWLWRKHLAVMQRTDFTAPNVPTISASATSSSAITVSLTGASTDAGSGMWGYILERSTSSNFTANLITEATGASVFPRSVTGLSASTTYYFRVRAVDNAGNVSAHSSTASATTQASGGTGLRNLFVANFSTPTQTGFPANCYNFSNRNQFGGGVTLSHLPTGGPTGGPCAHHLFAAGFVANTWTPSASFHGWATGNLGHNFSYGEPIYIRFIIRYDDNWRWVHTPNKLVMLGSTGTTPNSRIIVHNFPNENESGGNGGGNLGWLNFPQAQPANFGLSNTTWGTNWQNDTQRIYGSLSVHNNIGWNCAGPALVTYGNNPNPPVPGPNSAAPTAGNCWYYVQIEALPNPGEGQNRFRIYVNNNSINAPTVDQYFWNPGNPGEAGLGVTGWSGTATIGGYGDGHPSQAQGWRLAGFVVSRDFDPNWYPG